MKAIPYIVAFTCCISVTSCNKKVPHKTVEEDSTIIDTLVLTPDSSLLPKAVPEEESQAIDTVSISEVQEDEAHGGSTETTSREMSQDLRNEIRSFDRAIQRAYEQLEWIVEQATMSNPLGHASAGQSFDHLCIDMVEIARQQTRLERYLKAEGFDYMISEIDYKVERLTQQSERIRQYCGFEINEFMIKDYIQSHPY